MKLMKQHLLYALVTLTCAATAGCGEPKQVSPEQVDARLHAVLQEAVDSPDTRFPGALLYVSSPRIGTWTGAAGLADIASHTPIDPAMTFRTGSIMKILISTVTLQLMEEGRLSLEDPLSTVLPDSVTAAIPNSERITVRMLLSHTGGVPEWVNASVMAQVIANPKRIWSDGDWLHIAAEVGAAFPPGEGWAYSNTGYNLLGLFIERATGQPWRREVRKRILEPLMLKDTNLPEPGRAFAAENHARGYHLTDGQLVDLTHMDPSMAGAAGGHAQASTAADLARILDAVLAGDLFERDETLKEMLTFVDAPDEHGVPYFYGLGMEKYVFPGGIEMIGHSGSTAGFASVVSYLPDLKVTVSATVNSQDLESVYLRILLPAIEVLMEEASSDGPSS